MDKAIVATRPKATCVVRRADNVFLSKEKLFVPSMSTLGWTKRWCHSLESDTRRQLMEDNADR